MEIDQLSMNPAIMIPPIAFSANDQKRKNELKTVELMEHKRLKLEMKAEEVPRKEEKPITADEIRKLKEILRQEDAALQLLKKMKATRIISDPKKSKPVPKIEAKIKTENGVSQNVIGTVTVRTPKTEPGMSGAPIRNPTAVVGGSLSRSSSPMTQNDKVVVLSTAASYEKNRARKDQLKQQLNRTLKEITQAPPPPNTDVNFFPTTTNNEFLVLLGLELCVNRLKRDDNSDMEFESYTCAQCDRDFSPAWKFDLQDRRLCQKCYNRIQMKELTKVQQSKFAQFKAFWNDKEQELKEIDFQLQKDEEAIRQQRVEAEKERVRREQERTKKTELLRLKEKEAKAKNGLTGWAGQLSQTELMNQLLRNERKPKSSKLNPTPTPPYNSNPTQSMARSLAGALSTNGGSNQMNEQILRQLQQLAQTSGSTNRNPLSNHLASIHTQMLKQELLRRQEKLRQDREDASRQAALEQYRHQQVLDQARRQAQQQNSHKAHQANSNEQIIRNLLAIQQLMGRGANNGPNATNNILNQQVQHILQNTNPTALINAIQQQQNRGAGKN